MPSVPRCARGVVRARRGPERGARHRLGAVHPRRRPDPEPDPAGPLFVAHLTGERTPLLDPAARGALGRAELGDGPRRDARLRAGGSRSASAGRATPWWPRRAPPSDRCGCWAAAPSRPEFALLADALDEPLELLEVADASALGAALLAGAPERLRRVTGEALPRAEPAAALRQRFAAWTSLVQALR